MALEFIAVSLKRYDRRMNARAQDRSGPADRRRTPGAARSRRRAIAALVPRLDARFRARLRASASSARAGSSSRGMGKSGHIAGKIAATCASTGTPSFFMHAAEASHGDIGMITRDDVLLAISNSGETAEVLTLIPHLPRLGVPIIPLTGNAASIAGACRHASTWTSSVTEEACPLNLAPTASTTATLAIGDALAVALLEARGFTSTDFARSHPGGALGRKLLLHVADVMRTGDELPVVSPAVPAWRKAWWSCRRRASACAWSIEDGPRARRVHRRRPAPRAGPRSLDVHKTTMRDVMTSPGKRVKRHASSPAEAAHLMEKHRITALPVVDDARHAGGRAQRARPAARRGPVTSGFGVQVEAFQEPLAPRPAAGAGRGRRAHRRAVCSTDAKGESLKAFHVRDGYGIKQVAEAGITVAIISGRKSAAVACDARRTSGSGTCTQGVNDKLAALRKLAKARG